ncbi:hypothetical protein Taro_013234 [Colocasia esculenta]|uniref:COMM domain-containing protein 9 n=1 Tax=Colocasia esculenta TaxID=4460 RepID=A0A843UFD3_COLES|nr:hypothetical protein [Colocasia esculenta]
MERPPPLQQQQNRGGDASSSGAADWSHAMWGHLPLLVQANSKESVEYILQALWRTRKTGLDAADRAILRDMLHLHSDGDVDPVRSQPTSSPFLPLGNSSLLVCLRMLIRRCVHGNTGRDEIQKLFPEEVSPELQKLLTLLLQKFQREWREDAHRDQVSIPRLKAMTWIMANQNADSSDHVAVLSLKVPNASHSAPFFFNFHLAPALCVQLQGEAHSLSRDTEVKFQLTKDTLETMMRSMYIIRDQFSSPADTANGHPQAQETL